MAATMRAWQVQGTGEPRDVLHEVEVDLPEPGPGTVRIRVTAAGLGLPDVFMCRGTYPLTPPLPFTSGQEATGVVTAVGEGVDLPLGARIMSVTEFIGGFGSFAEECLVRADGAFAVPEGLTDPQAAGFWIPHLTGWVGLVDRGGIAAGDWLAVLGAAGGSGIAAVQLGKALGARVIAVVSDDGAGRVLPRPRRRRHGEPPGRPAARRRSGSSPTVRVSTWCTTRSEATSPRTPPARSPGTDGCSRSGSPAAGGRRSRPTTW